MNAWYVSHLVLIQATLVGVLTSASIQVPVRMGVFSFAGVGSYTIGAYFAAIMTIRYDLPVGLSILGAAAIAGSIGYLLALLLARLDGLYLGMATIAFVLILGVIAVNGGDLTGGPDGLYGASNDLGTGEVIVFTVVVLGLLALSERGRPGRRIDVVREDPELAVSMGISVARMRQLAFVTSGALGGCAGAVNALLRGTVAPDDLGFPLIVLTLTMIIVGGSRSWAGAVIGALVFTWLPQILQFIGSWQTIVYGVLVTVAAVWVPDGILGLLRRGYRALRVRPPSDPPSIGGPPGIAEKVDPTSTGADPIAPRHAGRIR